MMIGGNITSRLSQGANRRNSVVVGRVSFVKEASRAMSCLPRSPGCFALFYAEMPRRALFSKAPQHFGMLQPRAHPGKSQEHGWSGGISKLPHLHMHTDGGSKESREE